MSQVALAVNAVTIKHPTAEMQRIPHIVVCLSFPAGLVKSTSQPTTATTGTSIGDALPAHTPISVDLTCLVDANDATGVLTKPH